MKEDKDNSIIIDVSSLHSDENSRNKQENETKSVLQDENQENHVIEKDITDGFSFDHKVNEEDNDIFNSVETDKEKDASLPNDIDKNTDKVDESDNLSQIKLILRSEKTEIKEDIQDLKITTSNNENCKTEEKNIIKQEDDFSYNENYPPCATDAFSDLIHIIKKEPDLNLNVENDCLEPIDGVDNLIAFSENEGSLSVNLTHSLDEDSCKSKENSESDTRISSNSESSLLKNQKKRRRKKIFWYRRKKRKTEGNQVKHEISDNVPPTSCELKKVVNLNTISKGRAMTIISKRRSLDGVENINKKSRDFAIPSPSLADISLKAAVPESTATSVELSVSKLCLCRKKPQVFISGNNNAEDLYCQALDCIDHKIVGCCNAIPSQDVGLYRASEKAPYQMMCSVHQQRLLRHNCCPGCGLFCTQGKYLMCKSWHHYHKTCFASSNKSTAIACPHCGDNSPPKTVLVSIHSHKDPVFLPSQKPIRNMKSAKMSITRGKAQQLTENNEDPNFSAFLLNLEKDGASLSNGFSQVLQRDKLAHLLNIACRSFSKICCSNRYSHKSLYNAAQSGDVEKLLKVIASGLNPSYVFEENGRRTPLHLASENGHLPAVIILLQAKAQINVFDDEQNTPLTAAINAKHNDVVKYLIKCGADLKLKGEDGMSPLHIAAKCGNAGACFHILNGTHLPPRYIDSLDDGGWTPLVWASEFNHIDVVRLLVSKGADSLIKDAEQNIALHWAAFGGSIDIVEMFLNDGSDINAANVHGDTPLHIAARQNKYSCVLLLLARGARSDLKNKNGEYPRDCSESSNSDIYKGITLNMEISALLTKFQNRSPKIVSNDISRGKERNQIQCVNAIDDESEPGDFVYVNESCFTSKISIDKTITSLQSCKCRDICSSDSCHCGTISVKSWYDSDGKLKSDFNYTDPPLIFECNQACQCNRITCRNRVVQNGITCRFQLFKTEKRGWGVKTLNLIPKGTFVCEYVGEIISDWEADHREDDSYLFDLENRDGETYCIDARRYGNFARFINHMCVPNLMPVHIFVDHQDLRFPRIAFFANKDILPNEELGYNYGDKFWVIKCKSFTCVCGSEKCLYSEDTIKTTLENYQKKLSEDDNASVQK